MGRAFVLSGGSVHGAFQAGAIAEIFDSGNFIADAIYGTSVGSLNGAFIADRAGRAVIAGNAPVWSEIGNELYNFWLRKITGLEKIGKKRNLFQLLYAFLFNQFDGFIDTTVLKNLIKNEIKVENLRRSPVKFLACAVNVTTGEPIYASVETQPNIHDYIIASTAIPMAMPMQIIGKEPYVDGGIREVAPLNRAINEGADEIFCIVCQTTAAGSCSFNRKDAILLMDRLMTIVTNEIVNNDIILCRKINSLLEQSPQLAIVGTLKGKRQIDLKIIRPVEALNYDLENFDSEDIKQALEAGRKEARKLLIS